MRFSGIASEPRVNITATAAAFWSAIAATISAVAALVALGVNRANLRQSVKPEIQLLDWSRSTLQRGATAIDTIRIGTLKNVGRGVAMHVHMNIEGNMRNNVPLAFMSTAMLSLLASGESQPIELDIALLWQNVKERKSGKWLNLRLSILCWDTINRRHMTTFDLFVLNSPLIGSVSNEIARGVMLTTRVSSSRSVHALRLQRHVSRLPGLSWLAPK